MYFLLYILHTCLLHIHIGIHTYMYMYNVYTFIYIYIHVHYVCDCCVVAFPEEDMESGSDDEDSPKVHAAFPSGSKPVPLGWPKVKLYTHFNRWSALGFERVS